ncbi:MAG: hypothetical protein GTO71_09995, partial [Woeseiaceae bacterium]|nr:hypothetical protein [Woeseiaceae bacterium]NIP21409.1 hypothetical protein [Woeseiaceae bacterium]
MNIETHLRELGTIEIGSLRERILELDEPTWLDNEQRQNDYTVHRQTQSIILVFCDGPPND